MNARNFMRPDWAIFDRKDDNTELENDPFLSVLRRPYGRTTGTRMQYHVSRDLDISGGTGFLKVRGKDYMGLDGPVTGLKRIAPQRTSVITDDDDELLGFIYVDRRGVRVPLLPDEVVYINLPHGDNEWDRNPPAYVAGLPADVDNKALKFNAELLDNDNALPGYLVIEGLTPDQFKGWTAAWRAGETPGKTRVLSSQSGPGSRGNANYVRVGQSNQELMYDELRIGSHKDICLALGPPPTLLDPTDSTFTNVAEAKRFYTLGHTLPRWVWVRDAFTTQLEGDIEGGVDKLIGFDLSVIEEMSENLDAVVERNVKLLDRGVITINQFLTDIGKPTVPWGDEQPNKPAEEGALPAGNPDTLVNANNPTPNVDKPGDAVPAKGRIVVNTKAISDSTYLKKFNKAVDKHETAASDAMKSLLLEQGEAIAARIASKKGKALRKATEDWWDGERWKTDMSQVVHTAYSGAVGELGDLTMSTFQPGSEFDATSKRVTDYLKARTQTVTALVNDTTESDIRSAIGQIANEGGSVDDMVSAVRDYFTDQSTVRAERFARTEMVGAGNWSAIEAAKQTGIVSKKTWSASGDPCPECGDLEGVSVALDGSFGEVDQPPLHPNCRCTLLFELSEDQ